MPNQVNSMEVISIIGKARVCIWDSHMYAPRCRYHLDHIHW